MLRLPRSLQARLLGLVIGLVVLVWSIAAVLTWRGARHELDELLDGHLAQAAALLVVRQAGEIDDDHGVDAPRLHRYAPQVAFQVFHEGRLAARSAEAPLTPMASRDGFSTVEIEGRPWRVFATRGAQSDVHVYVGEQTASRESILRAVLRGAVAPMLLALPLLAVLAAWAIHRSTAPLRVLGRSLAERPAHDLHPVTVASAPSEMRPMVDALNNLFGRIAALLEAERRFTADASHELRTPIAAIRAQAQVALGETDDTKRRHALQATLAACERATRLVEQLLMLSRVEAEATFAAQHIDVGELTRRVVADLAPRALAKQQALTLEAPAGCTIAGDETLLAVLVRNLVDNAIRYSPVSARVRVRVWADGGHVVLEVDDSGHAMPEADIRRLGERFFRVPGHDESGSGLGWSISRRVAQVHGASLQVGRSADLGGLSVKATFSQ